MRPRKRILIWGDEMTASLLRIVLDTRGYAVEIAATEARLFEAGRSPDVFLLVGFGAAERERLEAALWNQSPAIGRVFVPARDSDPEWMRRLLEALWLATIRKRGPRKGWKSKAAGAVGERPEVLAERVA